MCRPVDTETLCICTADVCICLVRKRMWRKERERLIRRMEDETIAPVPTGSPLPSPLFVLSVFGSHRKSQQGQYMRVGYNAMPQNRCCQSLSIAQSGGVFFLFQLEFRGIDGSCDYFCDGQHWSRHRAVRRISRQLLAHRLFLSAFKNGSTIFCILRCLNRLFRPHGDKLRY